jgi:hypothetical protein
MNGGIYRALDGLDGWGYGGKAAQDESPYGPKPKLYTARTPPDPLYTGAGIEAQKVADSIAAIADWEAKMAKYSVQVGKGKAVQAAEGQAAALQAQLDKLKVSGPSPVVIGGALLAGVLVIGTIGMLAMRKSAPAQAVKNPRRSRRRRGSR